jgi:thiol-disulfide isomerase/thioredoxin
MPFKKATALTPATRADHQTGMAGRRALLLLAGLSATAAGVWLGLKRQGQPAAGSQTSTPATPSQQATASATSANAPLIQSDQLTTAFWQQQFDTPQGGKLSLSKAKGKPLLINFWATWCPPCVKEMPELDRFHREFAAKGWAVIGLAIDGPSPVKEFLSKVAVGFDLGLAGFDGTELAQILGNASGGLPFSVMIDAQGKVRHRKMGATHFDELATWARQIG